MGVMPKSFATPGAATESVARSPVLSASTSVISASTTKRNRPRVTAPTSGGSMEGASGPIT
jgi:hypothetical protein